MRTTCLIMLALLLHACADTNKTIHVGRYESSPWGFSTNTWWVEGPTGVVLMDTQFLPSAIEEAISIAENYTRKKVVLAFVLHANPDKFNGVAALNKRGIRVVTSQQVIDAIPDVDALRRAWFYQRYQPDYPEKLVLPESLNNATLISAAGLTFKVHTLGPSVSKAHIAVQLDNHVFVGDILANKQHAWLELGLVNEWIASLELINNLKPQYLYPGRGSAASPQLINEQIRYLHFVRDTVMNVSKCTPLDAGLKERIIKTIEDKYPNYGNAFFLQLGVEPVWESACNKAR